MMVEILDPKEGESIYDPACGTGGMLSRRHRPSARPPRASRHTAVRRRRP